MNPQSRAFKTLEAKWYGKLKDDGFQDIEDTADRDRRLKSWHSFYFSSRDRKNHVSSTEQYFRAARGFLHSFRFKNAAEKEVWGYHADGKTMREIAYLMEKRGPGFSKDSVNNLIRRLAALMEDENDDGPDSYSRWIEI